MDEIKANIKNLSKLLDSQIDAALMNAVPDAKDIMRIFETTRMIIRLMTCLWRIENGESEGVYIKASVPIPQDQREYQCMERRTAQGGAED